MTSLTFSSADPAAVRRAVEREGLAVLSRDDGDPARLERFVTELGPLVFTPGERPLPGTGHVFEVSNVGRTQQPPRSVWHTDTSYVSAPPVFTVLAAVTVPRAGGATLVIDQRQAVKAADVALLDALVGVELLHVASRVSRPDEAGEGAWHPVLRSVDVGGVRALYVGARERLAAARRNGVAIVPAEATELIDAAYELATSVAPVRHEWSSGDVLLIDNRTTLHAADHDAVDGDRVLHRVMCGAETPLPAW